MFYRFRQFEGCGRRTKFGSTVGEPRQSLSDMKCTDDRWVRFISGQIDEMNIKVVDFPIVKT